MDQIRREIIATVDSIKKCAGEFRYIYISLDEEKNGYVARDQWLHAL